MILKYVGRKEGSKANKEKQLAKYKDVVDLLKKSDLSLRRIASVTERTINTVIKVKNRSKSFPYPLFIPRFLVIVL